MSRNKVKISVVACLTLCAAVCLGQDVPTLITYVGEMTDNAGQPVSDTVDLDFRLYEGADPGSYPDPIWEEQHAGVQVDTGRFEVYLGESTPLTHLELGGADRWLGISVDAAMEMSPRLQLLSVPYALKAQDSLLLDGYEAASFVMVGDNIPGGSIQGAVAQCTDADTLDGLDSTEFSTVPHTPPPTQAEIIALGFVTGPHTSSLPFLSITGTADVTQIPECGNADTLDGLHSVGFEPAGSIATHEANNPHLSLVEHQELTGGSETALHTHDLGTSDINTDVLTSVFLGDYPAQDTPHAMTDIELFTSLINVPASGSIRDVMVTLQYIHPNLSEVQISLHSPTGTQVILHDYEPGVDIVGIFDANLLPSSGSMNDFDGESLTGDWELRVFDPSVGAAGSLVDWSLQLVYLSDTGARVNGDLEVTGNMAVSGTITQNGVPVWTSGNDGSGSGLDADLLDGRAVGFVEQRRFCMAKTTCTTTGNMSGCEGDTPDEICGNEFGSGWIQADCDATTCVGFHNTVEVTGSTVTLTTGGCANNTHSCDDAARGWCAEGGLDCSGWTSTGGTGNTAYGTGVLCTGGKHDPLCSTEYAILCVHL